MGINTEYKDFTLRSADVANDGAQQEKIRYAINQYDKAVADGTAKYARLLVARQRAGFIKHKVINELDRYLIEFEDNFTANGGKLIWARDAREALSEIEKIIKKHQITSVVKSKSMVTEEISLNDHLQKLGVEVVETDLGEFIVQQANDKPYHIVTPAMHFSKEDVATLYHEKLGAPEQLTPDEITAFTRDYMREKFAHAQMGITGANFLISDIGAIALTENEGNGLLSMALPKIHLVVTGIEKLIPSMDNLELFWPLLASHGTGQSVTAYNSILSGPRREGELSGPDEMIVVLIDNGRSKVLEQEKQRQALSCIKCGACLNACPVFKLIGGKSYGTTYPGPIGAVVTPFMKDFDTYKHLSYASTLCGKCDTVCPVNIPLRNLLLYNRNYAVKQKYVTGSEARKVRWMSKAMSSRKLLDMPGSGIKNMLIRFSIRKSWGNQRELPEAAPASFNQRWREQNK